MQTCLQETEWPIDLHVQCVSDFEADLKYTRIWQNITCRSLSNDMSVTDV